MSKDLFTSPGTHTEPECVVFGISGRVPGSTPSFSVGHIRVIEYWIMIFLLHSNATPMNLRLIFQLNHVFIALETFH